MDNIKGAGNTLLSPEQIRDEAIREERERQSKRRKEIAGMGGKATKAKRGPDYFKKLGQKGAKTRWGNKQKKDGTTT